MIPQHQTRKIALLDKFPQTSLSLYIFSPLLTWVVFILAMCLIVDSL